MLSKRSTAALVLGLVALGAALVWARRRRSRARSGRGRPPVTQVRVPVQPAGLPPSPVAGSLEWRLDEALRETYPASDSIAICIE